MSFLCDVLWFAFVLCFVVVERVLFVFDLFVLFDCDLLRSCRGCLVCFACAVMMFVCVCCLCAWML